MRNGFVFQNENFEMTGATQLSMGGGLEVSQRFAYDYSKNPQSIAYRKRATARTGSVSMVFGKTQVENIFDEVAKLESLAGRVGAFYWNGREIGNFLIRSVQLSFAIDGVDIISSAQVGLEIQEGYIEKKRKVKQAEFKLALL